MNEISINQIHEIGQYWLVYRKDSGEPGHIQLSACANNFAVHRNYESDDGLKCVGLHYEKDGCGYYELFNVGHTLIKCPFRANFGQAVVAMFKGKKPGELQRDEYLDIERQLNAYGWKTIES